MGFRAPYLLETARLVAASQFDLERLRAMPVEIARDELIKLPGVGRKIAACVLLFAYGFQSAFPVDVWVMKALRQLYFPKRKVTMQRMHRFAAKHFGICSGYAQQYLFHYMRTRGKLEYRNPKSEISLKSSQNDNVRSVEVLFTPADFEALSKRDLSETVCVVFDVLRATSSMITALANGAEAIIPVSEIVEALEIKRKDPEVLLAGERDGLRIEANLTGSISFDLGNSPREFTRDKVTGKTIVITTTNGTRALRACARAKSVLVSSFLNLQATKKFLQKEPSLQLLVICSGTFEQAAYEDVLGAGALCEAISPVQSRDNIADSALMAA